VASAPTNPRNAAAPIPVGKVPVFAAPLLAPGASAATPTPTKAVATPAAVAVPASAEPANNSARQLQAGREALAQAQSLWAAGSHDAATELLQQALSMVERSGGTSSTASLQLMSSLVRELGRMQLADGRAAASLDLLTRLEPVLGRDADIWALRGNAAQRLGRHQDSVRAYAAALQLRPNEQRWLLGSAVSLAALGQTAQASEMAERARAIGPISKEVQAYLRQAGVQTSEP
jgi:tetratricopeptide (TPR) repeat protein